MESFSPFRRRRCPRREEYTLLHDDSDGSQCSYSTKPSSGTGDSSKYSATHNQLCDKCWLQHKRSKALKRCMDCKQSLCVNCANRDENKRPWWLPSCIAQCMRFILCYTYMPHAIVDLDDWINDQEHWALRTETSNVNPIPRISRDSLRHRQRKRPVVSQNNNFNGKAFSNSREHLIDDGTERRHVQDGVSRSKSSDDVPSGFRGHSKLPKRSISVEKINKRLLRERRERDKIYSRNWDGDVWEQTRRRAGVPQTHSDTPHVNKVKGKDVDIVISGSEMKLILTDTTPSTKATATKNGHKDGFFRRKSKPKNTDKPYKPYTEEVFSENPIWFKRDSTKKDKCGSNTNSNEKRQTNNQAAGKTGNNNGAFEPSIINETTPYFVEEPPDQCPICLEELHGRETRVLTCTHILHTKCLVQYLHGMDNLDFGVRCPMCNRITEIRNYYAPREQWFREIPVSNQA